MACIDQKLETNHLKIYLSNLINLYFKQLERTKNYEKRSKKILNFIEGHCKDFIAELATISLEANKMSETFTKGISVIDALLGGENTSRVIEANVVEEPKEEKKEVTLEEVRTKLANLSRNGHTKEVKALLLKYGADKLSAIDKDKYEALLADAEGIGNA